MLRLMRKFSWAYVLYTLLSMAIIFPLFNHDRISGPRPHDLTFAYYLAFYFFLIIIGSIWSLEEMEKRFHGNRFLQTLPISRGEIVGAKLGLVFLTVFTYVIFHCAAFRAISSDPGFFGPSCALIILAGDFCLVTSALLYLGVFRFGFDRCRPWLLSAWLCLVILPLPLNTFLLPRFGLNIRDIVKVISSFPWIPPTLAALGLFVVISRLAIRALRLQAM